MKPLPRGRRGTFAVLVALMLLSGGCASAPNFAAVLPSASRDRSPRAWISDAAKHAKLVYIADHHANAVYIYNQGPNPHQLGTITDGVNGPEGLAVDASGMLYVVNQLGDTITEYPSGSISPTVTIRDGIEDPSAVAVDSTGRLYVSEGTNSEILSYPPGGKKPDRKIKKLANPDGMDVAANGDLFATYSAFPPSGVAVCARKCRELTLRTELAADVRVDLKGNVVVADDDLSKIYVFAQNASQPARTIDNGNATPLALALDATDDLLYVADESTDSVDEINYMTGALVRQIAIPDSAFGVALFPHQTAGP
jgi:DNA-binding beta-propeller fold protein YncE